MSNRQAEFKRVLMLATENAAIKGAKVGGIADVIGDLPHALIARNVIADVAMPGYGRLSSQNGAEQFAQISVPFAGRKERVDLYRLPHPVQPQASIYLFEHGLFAGHDGAIYNQGSTERPFAEDASKFALFNISVACALLDNIIPAPEILHLHDWHTGLFALLRAFDVRFKALQKLKCVFTVHNLALQGIRPLSHEASSLAAWYPEVFSSMSEAQLSQVTDPRYPFCINPMRAGIVLSDKVHLVSPSYAREVLLPSNPENGFFGGEGLEKDLRDKHDTGNLVGILNGCEYPETAPKKVANPLSLVLDKAETALIAWLGKHTQVMAVDMIALSRINRLRRQGITESELLLTSVGRLTDQKVLILRQRQADGKTVLEKILEQLAAYATNALFIFLGSGDEHIAAEFREVASRYSNFLFLHGYHDDLPQYLYRYGDLFLMASSFEPCGISQMLAMREGQPCLVHGVGGLKDTVKQGESGFVFGGKDLTEQADNLLVMLQHALQCRPTPQWQKIKRTAKAQRFDWHGVSNLYVQKLYSGK
ncbi:glycogen synthase [Neptunicella sp. SCSIO 80796]|uniref:glycogen synthase n=1 Tax=Neptunicella plasticusilytica TaxID=3117012 RepID=UPI003A4DF666